jgi:hypothetical protein
MPEQPFMSPIEDSVPKVGDVAVGEDLQFQRRWWKFERAVWFFFLLILIANLLGAFGRGWLAKAQRTDAAHTVTLDYERIERASTPSIMTFRFTSAAIHDGKIQLFVSEDLIKPLGSQRISPQPETSTLGNGGITYLFPVTQTPATAEIQLQPSFPGTHHFRIQVGGGQPIEGNILVVP